MIYPNRLLSEYLKIVQTVVYFDKKRAFHPLIADPASDLNHRLRVFFEKIN